MEKKLLVFDIDGTLVHNNKVSPKVIQTLKMAKQQGHLITIATGRNSRGILKVACLLGLNNGQTPIIGLNGAEVFYLNPDNSTNHLWQKPLTKQLSVELFETARTQKIDCVAYTLDEHYLYTNRRVSFLNFFMYLRSKRAEFIKLKKNLINLNLDVMKVICHGRSQNMQSFQEKMKSLGLEVFGWSYTEHKTHNIEVNMTGINKSVGMEKTAEILKIEQKDVIYFGDGANDKEALQWAGIGVAMGNAHDDIKSYANQVTLGVKEDGVAVWIEENILKTK
ncbi:5-amino-6-(5-phospho-D-ribitylamino)uracil phosphatase YitU [Mesoplasma sp. JKS002660]|uniref:Cof-type HAD-IIB family hydrolase n=1 Tax=Mesoplasma whartonense TaxID=2878854 RepID=UPI002022A11F|nr:HAD family hydrolase [Mesoplasma sp. JKS002660]MCL8213717.1 5-amino-6-(5-phospho-D-ribitylamino)uracil phosphatase YitU [Mesoplasma sp. JKS002660]